MTDVQGHQLTEQQEKSFIDTVALCVEILRDEDLTSRRQILLTEIMIMSIEALIGNRLGFPAGVNVGALRGDIKKAVLRWCFTSKDYNMKALIAEMDKIEIVKNV